ncbi:MAG: hypothetical protein N4A72_19990 [Bacteroidales bacterium]|jgi:hypothetical protein|nr:hypothetical protein [Bacteroidales bacterium]
MNDKNINCPNCNEKVEEGWNTCWNCETEIPNTPVKTESIYETETNKENSGYVKVDGDKIIYAGKQIKQVARLIILTLIVTLITSIAVIIGENYAYYIVAGIINFIILIIILVNIYHAGNDLVDSVKSQGSRSHSTHP